MVDFKKLADPQYRAQLQAEREAEEAAAHRRQLADEWIVLLLRARESSLTDQERSLTNSVRVQRFSLRLEATTAQRSWLQSIARRLRINATLPDPTLADFYDSLDQHQWKWDSAVCDEDTFAQAQSEHERFSLLARLSPEHEALFNAFWLHHADGGPKPARPPQTRTESPTESQRESPFARLASRPRG